MKRIFLTGANGHTGANVVRELLARDYQVVGLVRENSDLRSIAGLDIEIRKGDLLDYESLVKAMQGCDAVIHTTANNANWLPGGKDLDGTNTSGTENMFKAAKQHAIPRFIYTSSIGAFGGSPDQATQRNESDWNENPHMPVWKSKVKSEKLAHRLAQTLGLDLVVLIPSAIFGPLDFRQNPPTKTFLTILNGRGFVWDGIFPYVHVEDVARAHVDALTAGEPGERYLIHGVSMHLYQVAEMVEKMFGIRMPKMNPPKFVMRNVGRLLDTIGNFTKKPPLFDHRIYDDLMALNGNLDNSKSKQAFGIEYRSLEQIFADTVAWVIHAGMVSDRLASRYRGQYPAKPGWPT